jgi:hypothetical protein
MNIGLPVKAIGGKVSGKIAGFGYFFWEKLKSCGRFIVKK